MIESKIFYNDNGTISIRKQLRDDPTIFYQTSFGTLNNFLIESEIMDELKSFIKEDKGKINLCLIDFIKAEPCFSLELIWPNSQMTIIFDIPIDFYFKLKENNIDIDIDISEIYKDLKKNIQFIKFYNMLSDEEKLKLEIE